ncbi:alpha-ketoacid dehydrogenase subunit beta [Fictibacillus barbaricus]|uniref:Alpha-ketoacid dehydrogenase subunit beta n=1 Tax=Fictibacillus barbaricus TaxID=182136 RepID=A0ABS2ZCY7_9BACL|nr:alpha-ketoacid dehydrogenase subunit beta [Fictibacillus barbaricus]MBN3544595.1 alpha-ketoacid dehydrogenase subunit beta [Fictibacillus barbaricus]GGB65461.1 2-oxoisovalerate dehydrogenase subunit beta [Fictibacillus barbaricus]
MTTAVDTKKLTMVQAVTDGMRVMMKEQENVIVLGEDVGQNGGVFRATDGLVAEFGDHRVIDTPLAESGIIGTSIGLAMNGFKPIAEMQFLGFIYPAFNQIMTHASRIRARTLGAFTVPMVIRAPFGAGVRAPEIHSDSVEALFTGMPGMKVVVPSNPYDAKGMLISAIEDPDPVLFLEPMRCYRSTKMDVPDGKYNVPLGKAARLQEGDDVTIFAYGAMIDVVTKAAKTAEEKGIKCDVIDLRTLYPLDKEMIAESVQKTGRAVIVHEAPGTGGLGETIMSLINDTSFLYMKAPVERVTGFDTPVPMFALEDHYLPSAERVVQAIEKVTQF